MEINYLLKKFNSGTVPDQIMVDGKHPAMVRAGLRVRAKIVEWYRTNLDCEVPQLGQYIAGSRTWKRGDLLALEMIRKGKDVPETSESRESEMIKYLLEMSKPGIWGSTPEYMAAALMINSKIHIWQQNEKNELTIVNETHEASDSINLLFERNHYSCLITKEQYGELEKYIGSEKLHHLRQIK